MAEAGPRVVISGCSGGGKSTLIAALAARGHRVVEEPGRRIVRAALAGEGGVLPWEDGAGFAAACIALAAEDWADVEGVAGPVFFDRSALDAAIWLERHGLPLPEGAGPVLARRFSHVVLAPPWPELRVEDAERRGGMDEAVAEYESLAAGYPAWGYDMRLLPKVPVAERIAFLARLLGRAL